MDKKTEREAALDILTAYFTDGGASLRSVTDKRAKSRANTSLVTELAFGVLRHYIYLDYIIDAYLSGGQKLRLQVRLILRLAAYQLIFTDKIPDYAAINEAVALCRKKGFGNLTGFVNAVLRKIANEGKNIPLPDFTKDPCRHTEIACSMPEWIVKMWHKKFGTEQTLKICQNLTKRPELTICANAKKTTPAALKNSLKSEGVTVTDTAHPYAFNISGQADMTKLKAYKNGMFHVMDLSSVIAADFLNIKEGAAVLDVCAAPGGKALYLAGRYNANITACDISTQKLALVAESAARLSLSIKTQKRDATIRAAGGAFAFVLVDAPCSGLGVLRRKPDIKLNRKSEDIESLAHLQLDILNNSASYVEKGGTLLYSTCTLSDKENKENIRLFLSRNKFTLDAEEEVLPHIYDSDGFYMARLIKHG